MAVKVHLEGDGLLFTDETSVFNAAQIIGFLKNSDSLEVGIRQPNTQRLMGSQSRLSPREALLQSTAKTNPQKIAVLGHYQANVTQHDSFSLEEVKAAFRKAGEPLPGNFSRDVSDAVSLGYIFEDESETGMYFLTDSATEYVQAGFPETSKKVKSQKLKREGGRRSGGSTRVVMNEELLQTIKPMADSLKAFIQDRREAYDKKATNQAAIIATWLLDEFGQIGMSPGDLHAVRRHLGEPIGNPSSQINNALNRDGYFSHSKEGRFILSGKGEDFGRIGSKN